MDKRLKMLTALTVIAIMTVAIVYASYWIYSNVVSITISGYMLHLYDPSFNGTHLTLSGYLLKDGEGLNGVIVGLYYDTTNSTWNTFIANVTTSGNGNFTYSWAQSTPNTYYFRAQYWVTP